MFSSFSLFLLFKNSRLYSPTIDHSMITLLLLPSSLALLSSLYFDCEMLFPIDMFFLPIPNEWKSGRLLLCLCFDLFSFRKNQMMYIAVSSCLLSVACYSLLIFFYSPLSTFPPHELDWSYLGRCLYKATSSLLFVGIFLLASLPWCPLPLDYMHDPTPLLAGWSSVPSNLSVDSQYSFLFLIYLLSFLFAFLLYF